jgi:hypothetical protein
VKAKGRYTPEPKQKAEGREEVDGLTVYSWQFEEERQERLRT